MEALETRFAIQENAILVAVGAISFAGAFVYPWLAGWSFFALGPALGIHRSVFGKRVRVLAAKLGTA